MTDAALVLLSGGQDSATCLAWALDRFERVHTVGFAYRQRHAQELDCRAPIRAGIAALDPAWAARLGADHMLDIPVLAHLSDSALVTDAPIEAPAQGLPNTFVPARNLLFLTLAAALAFTLDTPHIVLGVCQTDYSGYPDCRDDTIKAMQVALNLGLERRFAIHTPLMWRDKAATWRLAHRLGGAALVELIRTGTLSCYLGDRATTHDWGHGCGTCPACALRRQGWQAWRHGTQAAP